MEQENRAHFLGNSANTLLEFTATPEMGAADSPPLSR